MTESSSVIQTQLQTQSSSCVKETFFTSEQSPQQSGKAVKPVQGGRNLAVPLYAFG